MSNVQPVFVIGSARSGTTMIDRLLSSSDMFHEYRAETQLMSVCKKRYGDIFNNSKKRQIFLDDWFHSRSFTRSNLSKTEFIALLDTSFSYAELLLAFLEKMTLKADKKYIVDSTPANIEYIKDIVAQCKHAKFIWIIRDGRDVSLSQTKLGWINSPFPFTHREDRLHYALVNWMVTNSTPVNSISTNVEIIKYEDFVKQPHSVLTKLAHFIGLPEEEFGLSEIINQPQTNTAYGKIKPGDQPSFLMRWKSIDNHLLQNFTYGCTSKISSHGYIENKEMKSIRNLIRYLYFSAHIKIKKTLTKRLSFSSFTTEQLEKSTVKD